jgi:hypothetical protein
MTWDPLWCAGGVVILGAALAWWFWWLNRRRPRGPSETRYEPEDDYAQRRRELEAQRRDMEKLEGDE